MTRGHAFRPFDGDSIAVLPGEDHRHDALCFADEVVVDFPSVAPAIDRMRSAFVADERSTALNVPMSVSADDARQGARLPLAVPVRCTCRACGGRGESWASVCSHCGGSGMELTQHQLQVRLPPGVADGATFSFTVTPRHHPSTRIELHVSVV